MTTITTTFTKLKLAGACGQKPGSGEGYDKLAQHLGGVTKHGKNTPISLAVIARSNGLDDALWCLRATNEDYDTVVRPFLLGYLADILALADLPQESQTLLSEGVALLRDPATATAQITQYRKVAAWAAWADWAAVADWAAGEAVAAWAAMREWQTLRFIELLEKE